LDPANDALADDALEAALTWRIRLHDARAASTPAFEAWLAGDPAHAAAWTRAQALWTEIDGLTAQAPMQAAAREVLARGPRRPALPAGLTRRRAAAAAFVTLAGAGGGAAWVLNRPAVYATGVGEKRLVTLADQSRVLLDSASRLEVRYRRGSRDLALVSGQAKFQVAHDAGRPFRVTAGDRLVVATGTIFNVELVERQVLVTLIEGGVTVSGAALGSPLPPVRLRPGERLTAAPPAPGRPAARAEVAEVSAQKATAWESGSLIFDNEPLSLVAERVSRYTARRVVLGDDRARAQRISGVFQAGDLPAFVEAITSYLPVDADPGPDGEIVLRSRD